MVLLRQEVMEAYRQLQATLEEEAEHWCFLDWSTPEATLTLSLPEGASPWQIDDVLREAMRLQQHVQHFLMRLLRTLNTLHLTSDMMFAGIDHYVRERLGMASRTARTLIKLDRDLTERPQLTPRFGQAASRRRRRNCSCRSPPRIRRRRGSRMLIRSPRCS